MTEASWARPEERNEIVDFCDLVFSKAHCPHDFTTLLPKLYGEGGDGAAHHFVVREEGKLAATVLVYPVPMRIGNRELLTLGVGSVSTRPGARGKGYMRLIMDAVDARAKSRRRKSEISVMVPTVERGLVPVVFCSIAMMGLSPSMLSTLGFSSIPMKCLA